MKQICPKCEKGEFSIVKRDDEAFCYVCCDSCGCIVGVLEDVDFKKTNSGIESKYKKIIQNHGFFEQKINEIQEKLDKIIKNNAYLTEQNEILSGQVDRLARKIK